MNKISAITVFVGDPYLALTFYKSYKKFWEHEIDEFVIGISTIKDDIAEFIKNLWLNDSKVKLFTFKNDTGYGSPDHGTLLDELVKYTKHDIVMTIDSDLFILKKNVISYLKSKLNSYDVIGSIAGRVDGDMDLIRKFQQKLGQKIGRICPCFSLCKKYFLKELKFPTYKSVFIKQQGDSFIISPDDANDRFIPFKNELWLETMGWVTYNLFKNKAKLFELPQSCDQYYHMTGVSMGVRKYMIDKNTNFIFDRNVAYQKLPCRHIAKIYYNYVKNKNDYKNQDYYDSLMDLIKISNTSEEKLLQDKSFDFLDCIFTDILPK